MREIDRISKYIHGEDNLIKFWEDYFARHEWKDGEQFGIYVDFPFCRSICKYCAFGSYRFCEHLDDIPIYEEAVINLIDKMKHLLTIKTPNNIYFGGGTPTLWTMESLRKIVGLIPNYNDILIRKTEAHPHDLTPERIKFMIEEMNINSVSIGVQSFDLGSNQGQNRIPANLGRLTEAVKEFQRHDVFVNIDIVALFNGETEHDWDLLERDLEIGANIVQPDSFCVNPNFRVADYYGHSPRFRTALKAFTDNNTQYTLQSDHCYSLDRKDIEEFLDGTYMLMTQKYRDFLVASNPAMLNRTRLSSGYSNVIGFGGNRIHQAISRTAEFDQINSHFDFYNKRWVHYMCPINVVDIVPNHQPPPIHIGHCVIKPNKEE